MTKTQALVNVTNEKNEAGSFHKSHETITQMVWPIPYRSFTGFWSAPLHSTTPSLGIVPSR